MNARVSVKTRDQIRIDMQQALRDNNTEAYMAAYDQMIECIGQEIREEYDQRFDELLEQTESRILAFRGVRQLTPTETTYYQKLAEAMKSRDPKQAISTLDVVMPETVINSVLDDLRTNHPLLSRIDFIPTGAAIKMLVNTNAYQRAEWGALCADIIKELTSGFKAIDSTLFKLSAFLPVCKAMLDLGPVWLDNYVRQVLYEALANGLEHGIINGTGKEMPIGMVRDVSDDVSVVGGEYPEKTATKITDLSSVTVGGLLGRLAVDPNGKRRRVDNVVLIVSAEDYYSKVMPATTLMAPDGTYRNDVLPYPMATIVSGELPAGKAVIGLSKRYFAAAGMAKDGRIEYSDEYRFLEDERMYLIKLYANGMPLDDNAFIVLDISGLKPAALRVETVAVGDEA